MSLRRATTMPRELRRDLPSLTSLRAFAALLVFAYHMESAFPGNSARFGYAGVAFFFVLSGFVLTWGGGTGSSVKRFYIRRAARIYPSHLAVMLVVLALSAYLPRLAAKEPTFGQAIIDALLLQAWTLDGPSVYSINGVAWSLSCEIFFYALFPLILWVQRSIKLRTFWIIAGAAFVAANIVVVWSSRTAFGGELFMFGSVSPIVRLPEFLLGIAAARSLQAGHRIKPVHVVAVAIVALAGTVFFHDRPAMDTWATPVCLLIVAWFAQRDVVYSRHPLTASWLVYAGKISFAFYLVHQQVIWFAEMALGRGHVASLVALVVATGLAAAVHHLIELPAHKAITGAAWARKVTTPSDPVSQSS